MEYSVLISSRNEGSALRRTVDEVLRCAPMSAFEVVVVDDASEDGSAGFLESSEYAGAPIVLHRNPMARGLIASRARAAALARGRHLCVLDAHCSLEPGWLDVLAEVLSSMEGRGLVVPSIWVLDPESWTIRENKGGTTASTIVNPFLDFEWTEPRELNGLSCTCTIGGGAWMARREWYEHIGRLDEGMVRWGGENIDLPLRSWLAGGSCVVADDVRVGHLFKSADPAARSGANDRALTHNKLRAAHTVFSRKTFLSMLDTLRLLPGFEEAMEDIHRSAGAIGGLKGRFEAVRRRSDAWLLETFELPVLEPPGFFCAPRKARRRTDHRPRALIRSHPRISVVLVGSETGEGLSRLARAVLETTTYSRYEILLVSSGASGGSLGKSGGPSVPDSRRMGFLHTSASPGGSLAYNLAALQSSGEYLVFLCEDLMVRDAHWLEKLVLLFEGRKELLLVCPRITPELRRERASARRIPDTFETLWDWSAPGFCRERSGRPRSRRPYQAFSAPPLAFALHRERFLELGGFDRTVTAGPPPVLDLSVHAWLAGYEVYCHPGVVLERRHPDASGATRTEPASRSTLEYAQVLPAVKYFTDQRRITTCLERSPDATPLLERNRFFLQRRRRSFRGYARFDEEWLFYKFGIVDRGE